MQSLASSASNVDAITAESIKQLQMLITAYLDQYDARVMPPSLLSTILAVSFDANKHLDDTDACQLFIRCFRALCEVAYSFPLVPAVLRLLEDSTRAANDVLPPTISKLFAQSQEYSRPANDYHALRASVPIDLDKVGKDEEAARTDRLVEKWNSMSLSGAKETHAEEGGNN